MDPAVGTETSSSRRRFPGSATDGEALSTCGRQECADAHLLADGLIPAAHRLVLRSAELGYAGPGWWFLPIDGGRDGQQSERRWRAAVHQRPSRAPLALVEAFWCPCEPALAPLTGRARIVAFGQSTPPAYDQIQLWRIITRTCRS